MLGQPGLTSAVRSELVTIVSGTFGFDPGAYLASGSTAVNNGNGTWTVTAAKEILLQKRIGKRKKALKCCAPKVGETEAEPPPNRSMLSLPVGRAAIKGHKPSGVCAL